MDKHIHKKDLKVLAIIPARSGSKGISHKNIKPLAGRPLMAWIIQAVKKSKYVNRIILSTDSKKYAAIGKKYGAEIPHLRPKRLAQDLVTDFEYVKYTLDWLAQHENYYPDIIVRLFTTVPLQMPQDIDAGVEELLKDSQADSAIVIAKAKQHPAKALKIIKDKKGGQLLKGYISGTSQDVEPQPRQKFTPAYFRSNIVISHLKTIYKYNSLTGNRIKAHIIPQERAIDIDSLLDFFIAEKLIEKYKK